MVPLGVRDEPHMETVKLYCPKCQDIYVHPSHAAQSKFFYAKATALEMKKKKILFRLGSLRRFDPYCRCSIMLTFVHYTATFI